MRRIVMLLAVFVLWILCLVPNTHGAERGRGYIYDGVGRASNLSIVIDVVTHDVVIKHAADARFDTSSSDNTNRYQNCGNAAFYCLTGLLEIVIPKVMPMKHWEYHGLSCQSTPQPGGDVYRIVCRSPKWHGRPTFSYSLSHGVTSIESSPIAGDHRYELRGKCGLFSPGHNP